MDDPAAAVAVLRRAAPARRQLAIDDFGTEYSSLAYLKRFPVTSLKIDKSFVDSLDEEDSSDATLIAAVVAMAHALGISTIAEGVETPNQARRLIELGLRCRPGLPLLAPGARRADSLPRQLAGQGRPGGAGPAHLRPAFGARTITTR